MDQAASGYRECGARSSPLVVQSKDLRTVMAWFASILGVVPTVAYVLFVALSTSDWVAKSMTSLFVVLFWAIAVALRLEWSSRYALILDAGRTRLLVRRERRFRRHHVREYAWDETSTLEVEVEEVGDSRTDWVRLANGRGGERLFSLPGHEESKRLVDAFSSALAADEAAGRGES